MLATAASGPIPFATSATIYLLLAIGLSALAVGLGARMPELHQTSPARIAAGFGGTLTLILSALFVIALVLPPAFPAYIIYSQTDVAQLPATNAEKHSIARCPRPSRLSPPMFALPVSEI